MTYKSREKHILNIYRYFHSQPIRNKEKRISLASNNKTETYNKNGALSITLYQ